MTLTAHQRTILALRADGATRTEVLDRLDITLTTYHHDLRNAYRALGIEECVESNADGALHEAWRRLGWLRVRHCTCPCRCERPSDNPFCPACESTCATEFDPPGYDFASN